MPPARRPPSPATHPPTRAPASSTEPHQPSCRPPQPRWQRPSPQPGPACPAAPQAQPVTASAAGPPRGGAPGKTSSAGPARWTRSPSRSGTGPRSAATPATSPAPSCRHDRHGAGSRRPVRRQAPSRVLLMHRLHHTGPPPGRNYSTGRHRYATSIIQAGARRAGQGVAAGPAAARNAPSGRA